MRNSKRFIFITALLLCVVCAAAAMADSALAGLWKSGCDFLFRTDNVTVKGEMSFSVGGKHFKTAYLDHVQDGFKSYYGLKLLTPRRDGTERETGWTIIADGEGGYYVMEAYYPGTYSFGHGAPNNTLLRRTAQLDALTDLGGLLIGQLDPLLPEGMVTATEADGLRTVHIAVSEGQLPDIAESALNLAATYLANRWFCYGYDRSAALEDESNTYDSYVTDTQALTYGTVRWTLRAADVDFTTDAQGRLAKVKGSVKAASTYWDQSVREVEVQFDLDITDYGTSSVKPFSAEEYGVKPRDMWMGEEMEYEELSVDEEAWNRYMDRADAILSAQGYDMSGVSSRGGWVIGNTVDIEIETAGDTRYEIVFAEDGSVLSLDAMKEMWLFADETDPDEAAEKEAAEAEALIRSFVGENVPALADAVKALKVQTVLKTSDDCYCLTFADEEASVAYFVVQMKPTLQLIYYAKLMFD